MEKKKHRARKQRERLWPKLLGGFLGLVLLSAAAAGVVLWKLGVHTVTWVTAEGSTTQTVFSQSKTPVPQVEAPEKLRFVGWVDAFGRRETRPWLHVYEDTVYTAQYMTALRTDEHLPYLFADAEGLYFPENKLTRGDAALAVYSQLSGAVSTTAGFADVEESSPYYKAVAQLKALGAISGTRFYPEDDITLAELLDMVYPFFAPAAEITEFSHISAGDFGYDAFCTAASNGWIDTDADPNATMTRLEAAYLLNRVFGRSVEERTVEQTGSLPDCGPLGEDYDQMAEACVRHSYTNENGAEHWTASEPSALKYSGYVIVAGKLRFADENGLFVSGYNEDGFFFVDSGSFTSGSTELDDYVWAILSECTDPSMTRYEKLRAAYDYVVNNYTYLRRNYYEVEETGWEVKEALLMFETGKGNCYTYAAAFWALARGLGFDARAVSGLCAPGTEHGWVVITTEYGEFICDPEIESTRLDEKGRKYNRFMLSWNQYYTWGYTPEPATDKETETQFDQKTNEFLVYDKSNWLLLSSHPAV